MLFMLIQIISEWFAGSIANVLEELGCNVFMNIFNWFKKHFSKKKSRIMLLVSGRDYYVIIDTPSKKILKKVSPKRISNLHNLTNEDASWVIGMIDHINHQR